MMSAFSTVPFSQVAKLDGDVFTAEDLNNFKDVTGVEDTNEAITILLSANGDINEAVQLYFDRITTVNLVPRVGLTRQPPERNTFPFPSISKPFPKKGINLTSDLLSSPRSNNSPKKDNNPRILEFMITLTVPHYSSDVDIIERILINEIATVQELKNLFFRRRKNDLLASAKELGLNEEILISALTLREVAGNLDLEDNVVLRDLNLPNKNTWTAQLLLPHLQKNGSSLPDLEHSVELRLQLSALPDSHSDSMSKLGEFFYILQLPLDTHLDALINDVTNAVAIPADVQLWEILSKKFSSPGWDGLNDLVNDLNLHHASGRTLNDYNLQPHASYALRVSRSSLIVLDSDKSSTLYRTTNSSKEYEFKNSSSMNKKLSSFLDSNSSSLVSTLNNMHLKTGGSVEGFSTRALPPSPRYEDHLKTTSSDSLSQINSSEINTFHNQTRDNSSFCNSRSHKVDPSIPSSLSGSNLGAVTSSGPAKSFPSKEKHNDLSTREENKYHPPMGSTSLSSISNLCGIHERVSKLAEYSRALPERLETRENSIKSRNQNKTGAKGTTITKAKNEIVDFPPLIPVELIHNPCRAIENFSTVFLERYCSQSACMLPPPFTCCSLDEALKHCLKTPRIADRKSFFMFLQNDKSLLSNTFCQNILCSQEIFHFFSFNDLSIWPWDVTQRAAKDKLLQWLQPRLSSLARSVQSTPKDTFPLLIMIGQIAGSLEVLLIVTGSGSTLPEEFADSKFAQLGSAERSMHSAKGISPRLLGENLKPDVVLSKIIYKLHQYTDMLAPEIAAEDKHIEYQMIRNMQDEAFNASLLEDQMKSKAKKEKEDELKQKEEKLRFEKAAEEERCRILSGSLPDEPPSPDSPEGIAFMSTFAGFLAVATVRIRVPPHSKLGQDGIISRRFRGIDRLADLKNFIESLGFSLNSYSIATQFPRRDLTMVDESLQLHELGFVPQAALVIENKI